MQAPNMQARQGKQAQDEALRIPCTAMCTSSCSPDRKDEILQHARQRIGLWKQGRLCSDYYIRFWSGVVSRATVLFTLRKCWKRRSAARWE